MKHWKVGIIKDTSKPDLGLHGLHTAFLGLPGVEIAALADSNPRMCEDIMKFTQAERRYYDPAEMIEREKPDIVIITSRRPSDHLPQIRMRLSGSLRKAASNSAWRIPGVTGHHTGQ